MAELLKTLTAICDTRELADGTIQVVPATLDQLSAIVSSANRHHAALDSMGAGTHCWLCRESPSANIRLDMRKFSGISHYEPADMTLTAKAGTPMREIRKELDAAGQELAVDNHDDDATLGGIFASGWNGLRARGLGLNRDRLIGMQAMLPDSTLFQSGGQVVKNVTGYDLGRLLAGAHGTLGIFTEISVRVTPRPKHRRILIWPFYRLLSAARDMFRANRAIPVTACGAATAFLLPTISESPLCNAEVLGYVLLEGNHQKVTEVSQRLYRELGQPMVSVDREPRLQKLWQDLLGAPINLLDETQGMLEILFPPAVHEDILRLVHDDEHIAILSSDRGILHTSYRLDDAQHVEDLRASLAKLDALLLVRGEAPLGTDRWGTPQAWDWLLKLKHALDPNGILNPGHGIFGAANHG